MHLQSAAATAYDFVLNDAARILAVDDDPIQLEFAAVYLSTPTASVETVASALAGLEKLAAEPFDIVLVDLEMPGMNGLEMIRAIRADASLKDLPIIMVTSHEDIVSIDAAYRAGATSFVTKPVNWRLLSYQIRYVLRASRAAKSA